MFFVTIAILTTSSSFSRVRTDQGELLQARYLGSSIRTSWHCRQCIQGGSYPRQQPTMNLLCPMLPGTGNRQDDKPPRSAGVGTRPPCSLVHLPGQAPRCGGSLCHPSAMLPPILLIKPWLHPPPPEICNNRQAPGETGISTSRSSRPRTGEPTWRLLPRCRFPLVLLRSLHRTPPQQQLRGARSAGRPWPLTGQRRLRICICSLRRTRMSGGLLPAAHRRRTNGTTTSAGRSRCESVSLKSVCAAPRSSVSPRAAQSRGGAVGLPSAC